MAFTWRPNRGVTFNKWKACDRCGFDWPERALRRQKGDLVCPECWDDPSHEDHKAETELKEHEETLRPWDPD